MTEAPRDTLDEAIDAYEADLRTRLAAGGYWPPQPDIEGAGR